MPSPLEISHSRPPGRWGTWPFHVPGGWTEAGRSHGSLLGPRSWVDLQGRVSHVRTNLSSSPSALSLSLSLSLSIPAPLSTAPKYSAHGVYLTTCLTFRYPVNCLLWFPFSILRLVSVTIIGQCSTYKMHSMLKRASNCALTKESFKYMITVPYTDFLTKWGN